MSLSKDVIDVHLVEKESGAASLAELVHKKQLVRWCSWLSRLSHIYQMLDTRGPRFEPGPNHQFFPPVFPTSFNFFCFPFLLGLSILLCGPWAGYIFYFLTSHCVYSVGEAIAART